MKRILTFILSALLVCTLCACSSAIKAAAPDDTRHSGSASFSDDDEPPAAEPLPVETAEPAAAFVLSGTGWQCVEASVDGEKQDPDRVADANIYMEFQSETTVYVSGVGSDFEADYVFDAAAGVISMTDSSGVTQTMTLNENESISLIDPDGRMELIYVHTYDLDTDDSEAPAAEPIPFDLSDTVWEMTGADMREGGSSVPDGSLEFYQDGTGMFYYFGHSSEFEFYQYEDSVNFALIGHDKDLSGILDADTMTMSLTLGDLTNEIHGNLVFSIR